MHLSVARAALAAGARRCGLVSAMGAGAKSRVFYNRVQGELEGESARLPFAGLVIARPSLLVGDREALGQPKRPAEKAAAAVSKLLGRLTPADYRPIAAADLARALIARARGPRARGAALRRDAGLSDCRENGSPGSVFAKPGHTLNRVLYRKLCKSS